MSASVTDRIPLTVVTGFLGAGKTAAVGHLLTHATGPRTIVVKADVGDVCLDDRFLAEHAWQTHAVTEGHACCGGSPVDRLTQTLVCSAQERGGNEPIVVELSGLADPFPFLHRLATRPLERFRVAGVMTVVDARRFNASPRHAHTHHRQLMAADRVLLNKADSVSPRMLRRARQHVQHVNPNAAVIETTFGQFDSAMHPTLHHRGLPELPEAAAAVRTTEQVVTLQADTDVDPIKLSSWLTSVFKASNGRLLRIKGVVGMWGQPERFVVNAVGTQLDLRPDAHVPQMALRSQLVFVGQGLDTLGLRAGFQQCLREPWKGDHSCSSHACC